MTTAARTQPAAPDWLDPSLCVGRSRFLPLGDACLHVTEAGSGPPLLFVHGSPVWSVTWRDVIRPLASRFRCLAVDLPGLGLSAAPRDPGRSFGRNADLLHGLIEALDLSDLTLVLHATGGPSALEAACRVPERIRSVAVSSSFAWPLQEHPLLSRMVRVVGSAPFRFANIELNLLGRVTAHRARTIGRFDLSERRALLGPLRRRDARLHLQDLLSDLTRERPRFAALESQLSALRDRPFLLAYGAGDNGFRTGVFERWQTHFPRHRVAVHPRAGHFLSEDDPAYFARALERWLDLDVHPQDTEA